MPPGGVFKSGGRLLPYRFGKAKNYWIVRKRAVPPLKSENHFFAIETPLKLAKNNTPQTKSWLHPYISEQKPIFSNIRTTL